METLDKDSLENSFVKEGIDPNIVHEADAMLIFTKAFVKLPKIL